MVTFTVRTAAARSCGCVASRLVGWCVGCSCVQPDGGTGVLGQQRVAAIDREGQGCRSPMGSIDSRTHSREIGTVTTSGRRLNSKGLETGGREILRTTVRAGHRVSYLHLHMVGLHMVGLLRRGQRPSWLCHLGLPTNHAAGSAASRRSDREAPPSTGSPCAGKAFSKCRSAKARNDASAWAVFSVNCGGVRCRPPMSPTEVTEEHRGRISVEQAEMSRCVAGGGDDVQTHDCVAVLDGVGRDPGRTTQRVDIGGAAEDLRLR